MERIVCPNCQGHIIDLDASTCPCGDSVAVPRDALVEHWLVPPGREAEVQRAIDLRKSRGPMITVLSLLAVLPSAFVVMSFAPSLKAAGLSEWQGTAILGAAYLLAGFSSYFGMQWLVTPPLPVGRAEAERVSRRIDLRGP